MQISYLIRDQDAKFTKQFDDIIRSSGCKPKELPYKSPNLNPYSESFVGTIRRECLDHFIVVGEPHLKGSHFDVVRMSVEGVSGSSIARITGLSRNTVAWWLEPASVAL